MNTHRQSPLDQIEELVNPIVIDEGLYLEDIALKRAGKYSTLIVTVDLERGEGAVGSEQLESVSRKISEVLDAADPISGAYTLEVSTPGAERALTQWRHWSRAQGHKAHIVLADGSSYEARIVSVTEDPQRYDAPHDAAARNEEKTAENAEPDVSIMVYGVKNKQKVELGKRDLSFNEITSARIVVDL